MWQRKDIFPLVVGSDAVSTVGLGALGSSWLTVSIVFLQELERVTALQTNLQLAAVICTNARR